MKSNQHASPAGKKEKGEAEYRRRLGEEGSFWDERAERLQASGRIPLWFDHRRGQDVTSIPLSELKGAGIRANPVLFRAVYGDIIERILETAAAPKGTALDLGCGAGWFSLELARRGMSVDGLDIGSKQIDIARRISRESRMSSDPSIRGDFGRTNYRVTDLNRVRLPRSKYDVAVSMGTLHHIRNLDRLVREVVKSLKPGGRFIFWEYIGYSGVARLFPLLFKTAGTLAAPWKRLMKKGKGPSSVSPFEGVSRPEIMKMSQFGLSVESAESRFLFLPVVLTRTRLYRLPSPISLPLTRILRALDQALIRSGLFRGPFILGVTRKTGSGGKPEMRERVDHQGMFAHRQGRV